MTQLLPFVAILVALCASAADAAEDVPSAPSAAESNAVFWRTAAAPASTKDTVPLLLPQRPPAAAAVLLPEQGLDASRATPAVPGGALASDKNTSPAEAADSPTTEAAAGDVQGEFRLRLLDAQILVQARRLSEARREFEDLALAMPARPEPVTGLAGIAQLTGRWRRALALYGDALRIDPGEPSVVATVSAIERTQASRLRTDLEYRETQGGIGTDRATAVIGGLSGHQLFRDGWRLGFLFDTARIDASQVQRGDGTAGSFAGVRRRSELYLQHDGLDGPAASASFFLTGDVPGAGLRLELPDERGVTLLRADFRRPNWDFLQSLIEDGTRDRLAVGRRSQFSADLAGRLELGVNRYGIRGDRDVARTATLTGELRLGNLAGVRGLSTAYVFDGEYLQRRTKRIGAGGQSFAPLQILDRELHALTLGYTGALDVGAAVGAFTYEASGGYGVDRYGKSGPLLSGALGYSQGSFDLRLRASYVQNIGRTRGTTTVYGVALAWLF